jgi:hypothetical protein
LPLVSTTPAVPVAKFAVVKMGGKFATGVVGTVGKFAPSVVDTDGIFATGVVDTGGALSLANISTDPNVISGGLGEDDS